MFRGPFFSGHGVYLLTYLFNQLHISYRNEHSYYLFTVVIRKTWLWQRTLIFTSVRPIKKKNFESDSSRKGTKVPGSESSRERKFQGTFVPGSESSRERKFQGTKVPRNFRSRERKFHPMELSFPGAKVLWNESSSIPKIGGRPVIPLSEENIYLSRYTSSVKI